MNGCSERSRELSTGDFVRDWSGKMVIKKPKMLGQKYNKKCPSCDSKKAAFFWKGEYYMAHCLCCGAYAPKNLLKTVK
ncbi:Uncharacterized protein dnl_22500 [Desulfonema limicola]|uniref:Uncharacterized protein n=1 Tax=Desulfonema limicola TaxID=45656 RepID=A0A975GG62_9BACT|nr:hypothetical protein [Desulfonema limicola]QTA79965.1 Uncharacterized protein dnl_22500 [Desulfonema limicola]